VDCQADTWTLALVSAGPGGQELLWPASATIETQPDPGGGDVFGGIIDNINVPFDPGPGGGGPEFTLINGGNVPFLLSDSGSPGSRISIPRAWGRLENCTIAAPPAPPTPPPPAGRVINVNPGDSVTLWYDVCSVEHSWRVTGTTSAPRDLSSASPGSYFRTIIGNCLDIGYSGGDGGSGSGGTVNIYFTLNAYATANFYDDVFIYAFLEPCGIVLPSMSGAGQSNFDLSSAPCAVVLKVDQDVDSIIPARAGQLMAVANVGAQKVALNCCLPVGATGPGAPYLVYVESEGMVFIWADPLSPDLLTDGTGWRAVVDASGRTGALSLTTAFDAVNCVAINTDFALVNGRFQA
jgi:hypothetical protein